MPTVTRAAISLALLGLLLGWFLLFAPTMLGGPASYIMVSGQSMEPTLHGSDLAVLKKRSDYRPGDIVAFRVPKGEPAEGGMVIHRIVGGNAEEGFVMQGDNKQAPDFWHPSQDDIVGKMWFRVPGAGRYLSILQSPLVLGALASGVAVFLALSGGQDKKRSPQASPAVPSPAVPSPAVPSPAAPSHVMRRHWQPGLPLPLLLILLSGIGTALLFRRAQRG